MPIRTITAEYFEKHVGYPPDQDDLERCNCGKSGELGHFHCGWDFDQNLPQFMLPPKINEQPTYEGSKS